MKRLFAMTGVLLLVGLFALAARAQAPPASTPATEEAPGPCHMMTWCPVDAFDPDALLAFKDRLELTDEQVEKLQQAVAKARDEARSVLTEQQRETARSFGEAHWGMHEKGRKMMSAPGSQCKKGATMMCPMCPMMTKREDAAASREPTPTEQRRSRGSQRSGCPMMGM